MWDEPVSGSNQTTTRCKGNDPRVLKEKRGTETKKKDENILIMNIYLKIQSMLHPHSITAPF